MSMRHRIAAATVASALALTMAACGGGDDGGKGGGGGKSDTLTMAWPSVGTQLDPNVFEGLTGVYSFDIVMEGLTNYDTSKSLDAVPSADTASPGVASSWEVSDDRKSYTFHLRPDLKSEWGNPLTADDVVWTFQRILSAPKSVAGSVLLPSAHVDPDNPIEKVDEHTVILHLTQPSSVALAVMGYPDLGILDSVEAKKNATTDDPWATKWLATHSDSFAAYKLNKLDPGKQISYTANANFWGDQPAFKNLIVQAVPDGNTRAQLVQSGDVDIATDIPIAARKTIEDGKSASLVQQPDTNRHNLQLNTKDPALADPRVRQALSMAIDRDAIAKTIYQGFAKPALSPVSSTLDDDQPQYTHDPDGAKALLEQAGVKDLTIELTINSERPGPFAEDMARLIQTDWQAIGVTAQIKAIPTGADFEAQVAAKSLQAYLYTERPAFADPGYAMFLYLRSTSTLNNTGYVNPEFDALVDTILSSEGDARTAALKQATDILAKDQPNIPLVEVTAVNAENDRVKGYVMSPAGSPDLSHMSLS